MNKPSESVLDIMHDLVRRITDEKDRIVRELFAKKGFTMEYLIEHKDEFLIVETIGIPCVTSYSHKGRKLFDVVSEVMPDKDGYSTVFSVKEYGEEVS